MATTILPNITRLNVGAALRQMRCDCQHDPRELNALSKAALNLESCVWQYNGVQLIIESATQLSKRYHVDRTGCDCAAAKAGTPCWHLAAWNLIQRAARIAAATQPRQPKYTVEDYARIQREAAELF